MTQQEALEEISKKLKMAQTLVREAEDLARKSGVSFSPQLGDMINEENFTDYWVSSDSCF